MVGTDRFHAAYIGKALIRATLDRAKSIGLTRVELTVREPSKRAFALCEKMGFVAVEAKRNAVRV